MKWEKVGFYKNASDKEDDLGNPIFYKKRIASAKARISEWISQDTDLERRTVTHCNRAMVTDAHITDIRDSDYVLIDDTYYEITEIADGERFRVVRFEAYRP